MLPLNPFLRAFFRSTIPSQCVPVHDHILLVPTTDILLNSKDRDTGSHYSDLAGVDEFLGSHVLRVPKDTLPPGTLPASRESRAKAKQYTTFNGRTVVIKDSWVYSNKGFKSLNQAQLLNDVLYYPDTLEPHQWLIYYISKPLIGSLEPVSVGIKLRIRNEQFKSSASSSSSSSKLRSISSFDELLTTFPMIARQMQPGLERMLNDVCLTQDKLLPHRPSSSSSNEPNVSTEVSSDTATVHSASAAEIEEATRIELEKGIFQAIELFQRVDQSQLHLLATTTSVTGSAVERLIEKYVTEHLHDIYLFPKLCSLKVEEDERLEQKIAEMEYIDISQVGIPLPDKETKASVIKRIQRGIETFERLSEVKSPQAMMEILLETAQTLTAEDQDEKPKASNEKSDESHGMLTMNADMLVSLLLIVVIRSRVPHLHTCLSYMRNFTFIDDVEQGERGYALSTLEAVLFHITIDSDQMGRASKRNGELWRRIARGNVEGVRSLLEKKEKLKVDSDSISNGSSEMRFEDWVPRAIDAEEAQLEIQEPEYSEQGIEKEVEEVPEEHDKTRHMEIEQKMSKLPITELVPELHMDPMVSPGLDYPPDVEGSPLGNTTLDDDDEIDAEDPSTYGKIIEPKVLLNGDQQDESWSNSESVEPKTLIDDDNSSHMMEEEAETLREERGGPSEIALLEPEEDVEPIEAEAFKSPEPIEPKTLSPEAILENTVDEPVKAFKRQSILVTESKSKTMKPKFNAEVEFEDSSRTRTRLSRSHSMRSNASHYSYASSFASLDRLSRSQSLNEDLTSVEKLSKTRNANGDSIVMMAIMEQKREVLEYLINESTYFPLNWILEEENDEETTLLSAAVQGEDPLIVDILLKEFFKISESEFRSYLDRKDWMLRTACHYLFSKPDLIQQIGHLIPWTSRDRNGQTPLFALCRSYDNLMYKEMVISGIKCAEAAQNDSSLLHLDDHIDGRGNTLLHIVHDQTLLRMLLKRDADVNAINEKGFTALMLASKYGRIDTVRTLFYDNRVNPLAREYRGLTAVELAKDDEARNKFDDLVMFTYPPNEDSRITAVVRGIFVEDGSLRFVLKSSAPVGEYRYSITTCRRSLSDFRFLTERLSIEHPASWLPDMNVVRTPFQIPSKPSRAVLRDIQSQANNFIQTLLLHSTFSTHELLWEFFLVPDLQPEMMEERSKRKGEIRIESVQEDYSPVEDVKEAQIFVQHAKEVVRGINFAAKSIIRRTTNVRRTGLDLADTHSQVLKLLSTYTFLESSGHLRGFTKLITAITPTEADPMAHFLEDFRNIQASLVGVVMALDRPQKFIYEIGLLKKEVEKHTATMRRSDKAWPLGLMEDTRKGYHQEAADNVQKTKDKVDYLSRELRYHHTIAAAELAAFHGQHETAARKALQRFVKSQILAEREKLDALRRALRVIRRESPKGGGFWASSRRASSGSILHTRSLPTTLSAPMSSLEEPPTPASVITSPPPTPTVTAASLKDTITSAIKLNS